MKKAEKALYELNEVDELAEGNSPVHRFSALCKLLTTVIYILILTSIDKYALDKTISFLIYPLMMYPLAQISLTGSLHQMRHLLPFLILIGLFNPLLDKGIVSVSQIIHGCLPSRQMNTYRSSRSKASFTLCRGSARFIRIPQGSPKATPSCQATPTSVPRF